MVTAAHLTLHLYLCCHCCHCLHNFHLSSCSFVCLQMLDFNFCASAGDRFDAHNHHTILTALESCRQTSNGPCIVALLGQKLGPCLLPLSLSTSDFKKAVRLLLLLWVGGGLGARMERFPSRTKRSAMSGFICILQNVLFAFMDTYARTHTHTCFSVCFRLPPRVTMKNCYFGRGMSLMKTRYHPRIDSR